MTEHHPVQRWMKIFTRYPASEILPNDGGEYVTYTDHLAALRACEERVIAAAVQRVEEFEYVSTIGVVLASVVPKAAVIAAIKGDQP